MTDIGRLKELEAAATKGPWIRGGEMHTSTGPRFNVWQDTERDSLRICELARLPDAVFISELRNAAPHLLSEIETLRTQSGSLFDAIQHGDDEHRAWLKAAITAHFAGEPVPPPSGSGRKDAEIETLRARLADALEAMKQIQHTSTKIQADRIAASILASHKENTDG